MIVLVMGVAGAGKTTVGRMLAAALDYTFADADAFHSEASRAKMGCGVPLDDADRAPWLDALAAAIDGWLARDENVVLACSALKKSYRTRLLRDPARTGLVYLNGSPALLQARIEAREGHFAKSDLLSSQLAALEAPDDEDAVTVDVAASPEALVQTIVVGLKLETTSSQ
jgi:gluconokinase